MKIHLIYIVFEKSRLLDPDRMLSSRVSPQDNSMFVFPSTLLQISYDDGWYENHSRVFSPKRRQQIYQWYTQIMKEEEETTWYVFLFHPFYMYRMNDRHDDKTQEKIMIPYSSHKSRHCIAFGITNDYIKQEKFLKGIDEDILQCPEWGVLYDHGSRNKEWTYQEDQIMYMPRKSYPFFLFCTEKREIEHLFSYHEKKERQEDEYDLVLFQKNFPLIYFITLPKRIEWIKKCIRTWKFDMAEIVPAVTIYTKGTIHLKKNERNCFSSHISLLERAMEKQQNVFIMEDDVYISLAKWRKRYGNRTIISVMNEIFNELPTQWDIVYFGKCYDFCSTNKKVSEHLDQIFYPLCSHAYYVHKNTVPQLLHSYRQYKYLSHYPYDVFVKKIIQKNNLKVYGSNIFEQDPYVQSSIQSESGVEKEECIDKGLDQYLRLIVVISLSVLWILILIKVMLEWFKRIKRQE
jgi:GR25 family glycosyltransferase involved in LPS biosynthesis